jgi:hypothetical protein
MGTATIRKKKTPEEEEKEASKQERKKAAGVRNGERGVGGGEEGN